MVDARITAATTIATLAVALLAAGSASGAVERRSFAPSDTIIYDFTVEEQLHAIGADPKSSESSDASGAGTETLAVDRVDANGAAHGTLSVTYHGTSDGRAIDVTQWWRAALTAEGEIRADGPQPSLGESLDQALSYINGVTKGLGGRSLASGTTWKTAGPTDAPAEKLMIFDRVTGVQIYRTFRATVIQQTAQGAFVTAISGSPASGTIATGGTVYYDAAVGLLLGCAVRGQADIFAPAADLKHVSKTDIVNAQLRSWTQGAPANPAASSPVTPDASPSPSVDQSPAAAPEPAYTVTQSPIATSL